MFLIILFPLDHQKCQNNVLNFDEVIGAGNIFQKSVKDQMKQRAE